MQSIDIIELFHLDFIKQSNNQTLINSFACQDINVLNTTISEQMLKAAISEDESTIITVKVDNMFIERIRVRDLKDWFINHFSDNFLMNSISKALQNGLSTSPSKVKSIISAEKAKKTIDIDIDNWELLSDEEQINMLVNHNVKFKKKRGRPRKTEAKKKQNINDIIDEIEASIKINDIMDNV